MALSKNLRMVLIQKVAPTMRIIIMFSDCRIFVFSNTLKKVSGSVADIICIAQMRYKMVNNALLIDHWRLVFLGLRSCSNFLLIKTGCKVGPILWLRSCNCLRTALAETWSLKGRPILTMLLSSVFLSAMLTEGFRDSKLEITESIRLAGNQDG